MISEDHVTLKSNDAENTEINYSFLCCFNFALLINKQKHKLNVLYNHAK